MFDFVSEEEIIKVCAQIRNNELTSVFGDASPEEIMTLCGAWNSLSGFKRQDILRQALNSDNFSALAGVHLTNLTSSSNRFNRLSDEKAARVIMVLREFVASSEH